MHPFLNWRRIFQLLFLLETVLEAEALEISDEKRKVVPTSKKARANEKKQPFIASTNLENSAQDTVLLAKGQRLKRRKLYKGGDRFNRFKDLLIL